MQLAAHYSQLPPQILSMVSNKFLFAIILLYVYIGVQSLFYFFGGVVLTILVAMAFLNGPRLLDWANSPPHLQFNKYVLTGYRPISSVQDCIRSLFYMHNELGNIYTHGEFKYFGMKITCWLASYISLEINEWVCQLASNRAVQILPG